MLEMRERMEEEGGGDRWTEAQIDERVDRERKRQLDQWKVEEERLEQWKEERRQRDAEREALENGDAGNDGDRDGAAKRLTVV